MLRCRLLVFNSQTMTKLMDSERVIIQPYKIKANELDQSGCETLMRAILISYYKDYLNIAKIKNNQRYRTVYKKMLEGKLWSLRQFMNNPVFEVACAALGMDSDYAKRGLKETFDRLDKGELNAIDHNRSYGFRVDIVKS